MAVGIGKAASWTYLDGRLCLEAWNTLGSIKKAEAYFQSQGITNPTTGEPPTRMGIWSAAIRYALREPQAAREYLMEDERNRWVLEDDKFWRWILSSAYSSLGKRDFLKFIFEIQNSSMAHLLDDRDKDRVTLILKSSEVLEHEWDNRELRAREGDDIYNLSSKMHFMQRSRKDNSRN